MNIVADTNIFLAIALDEPEKEHVISLTAGTQPIAPEILPYEIGNALSAMVKRKQLTAAEAEAALGITNHIPVRLMRVDIAQALQLALQYNLYAYDAYFLHCAKTLSCPILTLDRGMREVAVAIGLELLE
jgi:predicted nucleic acid-binding protein